MNWIHSAELSGSFTGILESNHCMYIPAPYAPHLSVAFPHVQDVIKNRMAILEGGCRDDCQCGGWHRIDMSDLCSPWFFTCWLSFSYRLYWSEFFMLCSHKVVDIHTQLTISRHTINWKAHIILPPFYPLTHIMDKKPDHPALQVLEGKVTHSCKGAIYCPHDQVLIVCVDGACGCIRVAPVIGCCSWWWWELKIMWDHPTNHIPLKRDMTQNWTRTSCYK